jgi:hypothetical protein
MIGELGKIATQCDGVRCDMAMLVLPDVFERTWGRRATLFWPRAIASVRERVPGFCFMAEVYWDLEQLEGRRTRISPHLIRAPQEPVDPTIRQFYDRLLAVLRRDVVRHGTWQLLECTPAWQGNASWDVFVASIWQNDSRLLVTVNYAPNQSQCYVRLPFAELDGRGWKLTDLLGTASYDRDGSDLRSRGLYLDVPSWTCHAFDMTPL